MTSVPHIRCAHCGDVIGVYEPMTAIAGDVALHTSRAAAGDVSAFRRCYHAGCFALAGETRGGPPEQAPPTAQDPY